MLVEQAARPIFADLTNALKDTAVALAAGDPDRAEAVLRKAREIDARVAGLREALDAGYEIVRLYPSRRRSLGCLAPYAEASDSLNLAVRVKLAVRNTPVCWRAAAVDLVGRGEPTPDLLSEAVLDLAPAIEDLAGYLEQPGRAVEVPSGDVAIRFALKAPERPPLSSTSAGIRPTSVLVGQIGSTAVGLLWASGMHLDEAGELDGAVRGSSERRDDPDALSDVPA